ncbi:hypothetical protein [Salinadaptatus halalkaliphilus]|nr:hypothetical protein [Salinadaptatus halalkaliphilus]
MSRSDHRRRRLLEAQLGSVVTRPSRPVSRHSRPREVRQRG